MAEEKNFEPSAKKKKKAIKDGQIARSREITQALQLTVCFYIVFFLPFWCHTFIDLQHKIHKNSAPFNINANFEIWWHLFQIAGLFVGVFCLALVLVTLLSEFSQVGIKFSLDRIKPKLSNIDPISGLKKIFGGGGSGVSPIKSILEVFQLIILGVIIVGALWWTTFSFTIKIMRMEVSNFENVVVISSLILKDLSFYLIIISIAFGIFKYHQSRKQIRKQLMMDFEELKREYKEDEGDPHAKSERKAIHQELLQNGIMETVKKAKVVISDF